MKAYRNVRVLPDSKYQEMEESLGGKINYVTVELNGTLIEGFLFTRDERENVLTLTDTFEIALPLSLVEQKLSNRGFR